MTDSPHAVEMRDMSHCGKSVCGGIEIEIGGRGGSMREPVVYRIRDETFTFGKHYLKYFEDRSCEEKDRYADGAIRRTPEGQWVYRDEAVDVGATYVYWMEKADGTRVGPFPVKKRDPEIWWPHRKVCGDMQAMARRHADRVEFKSFGASAGGRDMAGLIVGNRERMIAVVGLIHAGESGPELMIPAVQRLLIEDGEWLKQVGVAILPSANPDERERNVDGVPYYLRTNGRGVDLNRNFPADWDIVDHMYNRRTDNPKSSTYRGDRPASESETRAVMRFVEETRPEAVFSCHFLASICDAWFLGCKAAESDLEYVRACRRFARAYTDGMYGEGAREISMSFGTTPGSLPAWIYRVFRVPAFDLEGDMANPEAAPAGTDRTTTDLLRLYQDRHYSGLRNVLKTMSAKSGDAAAPRITPRREC